MDMPDLISVVVTTYNRSDALVAVLAGLSRQTDLHFEVIVADDGSNAMHRSVLLASEEALRLAQTVTLTHVWHPDVGFTAAKVRNRGVACSLGNYIVFLDGDCVPEIDFVTQHRRLAQVAYVVNGSRILLSPRWTQHCLEGVEQISGRSKAYWFHRWWQNDANRLIGVLRLPDGPFRVKRHFSWKGIRSCNMAVWRSDFERIDGFDESFVGWGHEDADFVLRLHHAGILRKNGFCATEVFHLWHKEASRDQESQNAQRVMARSQGNLVRAELGYAQKRVGDDVVVTRLG